MITDSEILAAINREGSQRKAAAALGINSRTLERRLAGMRDTGVLGDVRTLVIDIETRPALVYTFDLRKAFIGPNQVVQWPGMMCFAAKWTDGDEVIFRSDWTCGHESMVRKAKALMDEADEVVGWNSQRFDAGWIESELDLLSLPCATPVRHIDLMRIVQKKQPQFPSFKLDSRSRFLGVGGKVSTGGFDLWRACIEQGYAEKVGMTQREARGLMEEYNRHDTLLTEQHYNRMLARGMVTGGHNMALGNGAVCPCCGGEKLQATRGYRTDLSAFRAWQCLDCGAVSRETRRRSDIRAQLKQVA